MTILFDDRYIFRMTDDTGIFQHAVFGVPDPSEGYTTDDNARALILAAMLYEENREEKYADLLNRYLRFLLYAHKGGWFRNFMNYSRKFTEKRGSEDCFGRCICALGYIVSRKGLPLTIRETAERLLTHTFRSCSSLEYIRGKSYALMGLTFWKTPSALPEENTLAESIAETYAQTRREDWRWFEDKMTYCNASLPLSMLCAYEFSQEHRLICIGLESLDFLLKTTMKNGIFKPIGCRGWYKKGEKPAEFDEQPVEACPMVLACLKAYHLTGESKYFQYAEQCFLWYLGANSINENMIDRETGGCRDGILPNGINKNQGAESIICYAIASLALNCEA